MNYAEALVAQHQRRGNREMALLQVQIRTADAPVLAGNHHSPGRRRRNLEFANDDRFSEALKHHRTAAEIRHSRRIDHAASLAAASSSGVSSTSSGAVSRQTTYSGRGSPT